MSLEGKVIGLGVTGSHCNFEQTMPVITELISKGAKVYPILSSAAFDHDTRFGKAIYWKERIEEITGQRILTTIPEVEPIGPAKRFDVFVIVPCTGNTMAKLANSITDTSVVMAAKAHLRNNRPVVLAISTNDALGNNAKNLGMLLNQKNIYFVPFGQDNFREKPNSLSARLEYLIPTIEAALEGKQLQPLLVQWE